MYRLIIIRNNTVYYNRRAITINLNCEGGLTIDLLLNYAFALRRNSTEDINRISVSIVSVSRNVLLRLVEELYIEGCCRAVSVRAFYALS